MIFLFIKFKNITSNKRKIKLGTREQEKLLRVYTTVKKAIKRCTKTEYVLNTKISLKEKTT